VGEPKIAFKQELMLRNEGRPRWRREDMRMAAMKTVLRTEDQKDSREIENELELELIQPHMAQKPMLRGEVGARVRVIRG